MSNALPISKNGLSGGKVMIIRKARAKEVDGIFSLLSQLWPNKELKPTCIQRVFHQRIDSPNAEGFLAEVGETIIGLLDVTFRQTLFYQGLTMMIEDVLICKQYRGKGFGTQFIHFAEEVARKRGCKAIELSSGVHRKRTHTFWKKRGYRCSNYHFHKVLSD